MAGHPESAVAALDLLPVSGGQLGDRDTADRLLTPVEVGQRLRLGMTKVYDMIATGQLPVIELGPRSKRISEKALNAWIAQRSRPAFE